MSTSETSNAAQEEALSGGSAVIARMKECLDARSDSELADRLGVGRANVSKWRKRNAVPNDQVVSAARLSSTSTEYLFSGKGRPHDLAVGDQYQLDEEIVLEALRLSRSLGIFELTVQDGSDDDLWRIAHSISLLYGRAQGLRERLIREGRASDADAKRQAIEAVFTAPRMRL